MNVLIGAVPGLVATAAVLLLIRGYHMLRTDPDLELTDDEIALLRGSAQKEAKGQSALGRLAAALAIRVRQLLPRRATDWLQSQIDLAGRPDGLDLDAVIAGSMRWALMLSPGMAIFILRGQVVFVIIGLTCVVVLPLARLSGLARKRQEQIQRDFPDFLDVLAVTVSAGIGFRSALSTVASRFGGPLGEEVQLTLHQVANGASLRSAFLALRQRSRNESINEFVTAYLQAEELGAPLVDTLNHIANDFRRAEAQRLRQKAARVEPRATLVVTLVMVPGTLILLSVGMYLGMDVDFGGILGG